MIKAIPQGGVGMNTTRNIILAVLLVAFVAGFSIVVNSSYAFSGMGIASITRSDPSEIQHDNMSFAPADHSYALGITGPLVSRNARNSDWDPGPFVCPADYSYAAAQPADPGPSVSMYARTSDWNSGVFSIGFLPKPC